MRALFGQRMRKTTAAAAVAAAAFAALSASQAPGVTDVPSGGRQSTGTADVPDAQAGDDSYYTDIPPLKSPAPNDPDAPTGDGSGIPETVLAAYQQAANALRGDNPDCNLPWELLAAIGKVESGHASGGKVDADGTVTVSNGILGPPLDGNGFAKITDTDGGLYDGDTVHDRAVGPMQFIPSTWETWRQDGNGDGKEDPKNIFDAALAAGKYLCANNRDLSKSSDMRQAILSYNRSTAYYEDVLAWFEHYRKGVDPLPDGTGDTPGNRNDDNIPDPDPTPTPTPPGSSGSGNSGGGGGDSGGGNTGGGGSTPEPGGSEDPDPSPSPDPDPTPEPVARLTRTGVTSFTATEGTAFASSPKVKAATSSGAGVARKIVRFEIVGDTEATFSGGAKTASVVTSASGIATAPAMQAGEQTGEFTIRATTTVGARVLSTEFSATVTARQADALTSATATLTGAPGAAFAEAVEVKATLNGAAAAGVEVTATMIKNPEGDPNDAGPYFKDADGKVIRTLTLATGADGTLKLPQIFADDTAGTYTLRLLAPGGGKLDIELKVAAAESPSPSPTP
ncbi:lytic transglycosylase domain-containing protein [Streptomyces indicus]|uniref:Membrane-bound lytic murein transglycosylase B n=1 Tax=Streptomyces indicus TaxID=417292 RepID=A0A1G8Z5X1_9ACTN|nr:lytic transglycosylase domain-containing protein [Streptomyces indicus]SDK10417.1 Membrane-bound lytic murein transglycosylase B [Streptomyces indicus]